MYPFFIYLYHPTLNTMNHLNKMNWASSKKVAETYETLQSDRTNPIMVALIQSQNISGLFHKVDDKVVMGAFHRTCTLNTDINTVLNKLFLGSGYTAHHLNHLGVASAYDDAQRSFKFPKEKDHWIAATPAKSVAEGVWTRRFGHCKNYAPRVSPISFNVFKGEDQYIYFNNGTITSVNVSACVFNGTTLRTVRVYRVTSETQGQCEVNMYFGGMFNNTVDPMQIMQGAQNVRCQTFQECSTATHGPWEWADHANTYLSQHF